MAQAVQEDNDKPPKEHNVLLQDNSWLRRKSAATTYMLMLNRP